MTSPFRIGVNYDVDVSSPDLDFSPVGNGTGGEQGYSTGAPAGGGQEGAAGSQQGNPGGSTGRSGGTAQTGGTSNWGLNPLGYSLPVPLIPDFLKKYWDALLILGAAAALYALTTHAAASPRPPARRRV